MKSVHLLKSLTAPICFAMAGLAQPAIITAQTLPVAFNDNTPSSQVGPTVLAVTVDFATVLRIDASIKAIAVGNAAIADANVVDPNTLILTGHAAGTTNLIALDETGTVVLDVMVRVDAQKPGMVTVRRGTQLETRECVSGNCSGVTDESLSNDTSLLAAASR